MTGKVIWLISSLPLWLGFCFVLFAVGIVLRRESKRYLHNSELLKIVSEFTEMWKTRIKGHTRTITIFAACSVAMAGLASLPLKHWIEPADTVIAHWWYLPNVPELMPDNEYIVVHMDRADPLYGTESRYTFCSKGERIDFDEGEMIQDVVYKEHGDCKELLHYNYQ